MKKEVENKNSFITDLSSSESSGDESEKEIPIENKKEIEKYLLNSDDEKTIKKNSPKKSKKLVKKRQNSSDNSVDQDQEKSPKSNKKTIKKSISKDSPKKTLVQGDDFKDFKTRQKNLAPHHLIIPKEKTTNTWLNTWAKRFTSVLPKLKIT